MEETIITETINILKTALVSANEATEKANRAASAADRAARMAHLVAHDLDVTIKALALRLREIRDGG